MARSGVSYEGTPASCRMRVASAVVAAPTQLASSVFPRRATMTFARARAASTRSAIDVGQLMTSTASTPGSSRITRSAASYRPPEASPWTSTGFPPDHAPGRMPASASTVSGDSSARRPSASTSASAASTPSPPPLVTIARRLPRWRLASASVSTAPNSSSSVNTRRMPERRNAASYTASEPATAPEWDAAAVMPASKRPPFTASTGFTRAAARAADMNLRVCRMPST